MSYRNIKILAVIGARSGSQSIKNKNLQLLKGKTLLYWIIKKALKSKFLDKVIVSTDSRHYQKLSVKYGALAPFLRPKNLSTSKAKEIDYIFHCLNWLKKNENFIPGIIVRLQPTSPFQLTSDIDLSIKKLFSNKLATSCQVVSESDSHPLKALQVEKKTGYLKPYFLNKKKNNVINRQILKKSYHRANIITSRVKYLLKNKDHIGRKSIKVEIPSLRALDINTKKDLLIAKLLNNVYKFL